ncbi:MAG: hypothetical protein NC124_02505 [Clostridium sp.]|nr:hypothetical protein [Clostridium sp.]
MLKEVKERTKYLAEGYKDLYNLLDILERNNALKLSFEEFVNSVKNIKDIELETINSEGVSLFYKSIRADIFFYDVFNNLQNAYYCGNDIFIDLNV